MSSFDKEGLYFIALGGAEEVGYNMYVYAVDGKLIVVDCGYGFFNDDFPAWELGFASPEALEAKLTILRACSLPTRTKIISAPLPTSGRN